MIILREISCEIAKSLKTHDENLGSIMRNIRITIPHEKQPGRNKNRRTSVRRLLYRGLNDGGFRQILLNRDQFRLFRFRSGFFREVQLQDAVLEFCVDIFLMQVFANVEASLAGSLETLSAKEFAFFRSFIIGGPGGGDGQITVFQFCLDVFFGKSRKIYIEGKSVFEFPGACYRTKL